MLTGGWRPRKRVDFCPAITQGAWVAVCEEGVVALPRPLALGRRAALALALGAGALLAVHLDVPAFFDNEARYPEVARVCWQTAECGGARRARWLAGLWAALGVGVLAKGLVPLVLAGLPIAAVTLRDHGWRGAARLRPGLGLLVLAAIVVPWHVAAALRHPGFAWDYVVNQHVLFFLDRKLP